MKLIFSEDQLAEFKACLSGLNCYIGSQDALYKRAKNPEDFANGNDAFVGKISLNEGRYKISLLPKYLCDLLKEKMHLD